MILTFTCDSQQDYAIRLADICGDESFNELDITSIPTTSNTRDQTYVLFSVILATLVQPISTHLANQQMTSLQRQVR